MREHEWHEARGVLFIIAGNTFNDWWFALVCYLTAVTCFATSFILWWRDKPKLSDA
jgi:hypothetical protein